MASATAIPQKRLGEFLKEQQEPFILENYLLERGYSKTWGLHRSANSCLNKNAKFLCYNVLKPLYKKFALHNESSSIIAKEPDIRNEDHIVPQTPTVDGIIVETDRFSSASSSTLFNSCSEIDEDETSCSSDTFQASNVCHIGVQSQQATNNGKHRWRCVGPVSLGKIPSHRAPVPQNGVAVNQDVRKIEKRIIHSCSIALPKKIREESMSSAAIWGLLIQLVKKERGTRKLRENLAPNISQVLKSKRVFQKTKQLLFDCVRETLPRKDDGEQGYKQFLGPQELGKLICKRTKTRHGRKLTYLFTLDDLNSIYECSDFESHVKDIIVEIADAILECINNEIVSEFTEYLPVM